MLPKQTEIKFYKTDCLVYRLSVKWRVSMTHILVTISDVMDRMLQVVFADACNTSSFKLLVVTGSVYKIRAYGLRNEEAPRKQTSGTSMYSVEASQTVTIFPSQLEGLHSKEIDMTASPAQIEMSQLRCQNEFEAEVVSETTVQSDHRLSAEVPAGTTTLLCSVFDERRKKEWLLISNKDFVPLPAISHSRTVYKVQAVALKGVGVEDKYFSFHQPLGSSSVLNVKTYMNKDDLLMLQQQAEVYRRWKATGRTNYTVKKLYRNKPKEYFDNIMSEGGPMEKYDKDNNGDQYSSINHQIQGLFFSASLNKKKRPPYFSFFGNKRLFLPVEALINDDENMYFADFYCNNEDSKVHYVTVVITKNLSKEDIYCKPRLLELERENPFFTVTKVDGQTVLMFPSVDKFHVEFFYTEDIDIVGLMEKFGSDKVTMKFTRTRGRGRSKADGIPKVRHCPHCNLSDSTSSHVLYGDLFGC